MTTLRKAYRLLLVFSLIFTVQSCTLDDLEDNSSISGKVTNLLGNELDHVDVHIVFLSGTVKTTTDSEGKYSAEIPYKGAATIYFRTIGYNLHKEQTAFIGGDKKEFNIQMTPDKHNTLSLTDQSN